jgi:hypothetical protein
MEVRILETLNVMSVVSQALLEKIERGNLDTLLASYNIQASIYTLFSCKMASVVLLASTEHLEVVSS